MVTMPVSSGYRHNFGISKEAGVRDVWSGTQVFPVFILFTRDIK